MNLDNIAHPDFGYNPNRRQRHHSASAPSEDFLGMQKNYDAAYHRQREEGAPAEMQEMPDIMRILRF